MCSELEREKAELTLNSVPLSDTKSRHTVASLLQQLQKQQQINVRIVAVLFMAALHSRRGHYIFAMWFLSSFFPLLIKRSQIGCLPYFYTWCGPSANLECRSEMCCAQLAGDAGPKNSPKIHHVDNIPELCRAISSQLRHVFTIGKKLIKHQCLPHMSSQYSELRSTLD